jgi:hypothetical protein
MTAASYYHDFIVCCRGLPSRRLAKFEKALGCQSMNKGWNGLTTCIAYGGCGGGQFNVPYCNCGPLMAAAVYPSVIGRGPTQSSILAPPLRSRRCSNQRDGNSSLPYKHFINMLKWKN